MGNPGKKILVVDDDPAINKLLKNLLSGKGYKIIVAENGGEAIDLVKAHRPDLIVLDILLPEINGYDICRSLKFDSPYKDIPIVLLTVRDREIDPRIGQMMGIDYVQKPFNSEEFLAKIVQVLK